MNPTVPKRPLRRTPLLGVAASALVCLLVAGCGSTVPVDDSLLSDGELTLGTLDGTLDGTGAASGSLGGSDSSMGGPGANGSVLDAPGAVTGAPGSTGAISGNGDGSAIPGAATGEAGASDAPGETGDGTAPGGAGGAGGGQLPATGFGYDEKNVWIGVTLSSDGNQAAQSFGLNSVNGGDQVLQARAMADYYNARGGILGRKVQLRFSDHSQAALVSQTATESQTVCEKFTQDEPVVAVVNTQTLLDTPALRACLKAKGLPMFGVSITAIDDQVVEESDGLYIPTLTPTWTRFAPVFVKSLKERNFFTGWDVRTAAPGPAPVKLGAFIKDDPVSERAYQELARALRAAGLPDPEVVRYSDVGTGGSAAVLRLASLGVTHVFSLDPNIFVFATAAESQGYRPRYALSTANGPGLLFEANAPKAQSYGALAVGTAPSLDLLGFPGEVTPGGKLCRSIMAAGGETFGSGKRFAEAFAFSICDSVRLFAEASTAGKGFSQDAFAAGIAAIGPRFKTAAAYATGARSGYPVLPGGARDIAYVKSCSCFRLDGSRTRAL